MSLAYAAYAAHAAEADTRIGRPRPVDFRALVGRAAWFQLPAPVRARFERGAHAHDPVFYPGVMEVRASLVGQLIAEVCRLIGTPLATGVGEEVPVNVEVRETPDGRVEWLRTYHFKRRAPVEVGSCKRMSADGELLEVVRGGLGMRLALTVEDHALHFRSARYFFETPAGRAPIPLWLTPGRAHVVHAHVADDVFHFTLSFVHPLFGETFFQTGLFRDPVRKRAS
ncbi:MAG TPA: DUF4166 domain-containing protein [Caulobacteraceae bacterium]|jgi:hypothetical protein|nr:DUF4166 domain-containing protein [Caulobacteraceae bacterium]